jgi:transcriptional regulator with XRE-family HTH domain
MPRSDVPLGPTGQRIIRNITQLRGRVTYKELSARLTELGRPIPTLGLSRLEKGNRRVDADDLVALALALGVTPNRLLLAPDAGNEPMPLTPAVTVTAYDAWRWATGEDDLSNRARKVFDLDRAVRFRRENHPQEPQDDYTFKELLGHKEHRAALAGLARAVQKAEATGVPPGTVRAWLEFSMTLSQLSALDEGAEHDSTEA